ncbi:hypothetical protein VPHK469_0141 [Vibrio phage K469]
MKRSLILAACLAVSSMAQAITITGSTKSIRVECEFRGSVYWPVEVYASRQSFYRLDFADGSVKLVPIDKCKVESTSHAKVKG